MFKEHCLTTQLWVPRTPQEIFPFFADAANLNSLTPPWLSFRILTPLPIQMQEGALIDYRIRLKGIPMGWRTRIGAWQPPFRFVDEQVRGPYLLWQHEHRFEPQEGGTLCVDVVRYKHIGGPLAQTLMVGPDLDRIFAYRKQRMQELWSTPRPAAASGV
jgi:ligand-binding SRPBCC domain-containing protein